MGEQKAKEYKYYKYRSFNKTIIILAISMIFLPVITYLIRLIFPNLIRCIYYEITYKPCPFCGFTTDIRNILKGHIWAYKYNLLSVPFLLGAIIEIILRIKLLQSNIKDKINKIIKIDLFIHITMFLLLLVYIGAFFKFNLARF